MTPQKKSPSQQMALAAFGAAILGIIGFFLPMISYSDYGISVERNGLDLIDTLGDVDICLIIGVISAGYAVVFGLMGMFNRNILCSAAVSAIVAVCPVFYLFIEKRMLDCAGIGFWLFVIGEGACFALSLVSVNKAKAE